MWVGFFWKKSPRAEPWEAQVQQLYEGSMPQKCAVCYLFHGPKKHGSKSEEVDGSHSHL